VCHGGGQPRAGLDLRTLDSILHGSRNGPVIQEGAADKSPLLRKIISGSMPPKGAGAPLNESEVLALREWIDSARFGSTAGPPPLREQFSEAEAPEITA